MKKIKFLSVFVLLILIFFAVYPKDIFANNKITVGKGKQFQSLVDAINAANPNDTIIIYPGEYLIPYNEKEKSFIKITKNGLTIKGVDELGNDFVGSDYTNVIISPAKYNGTVQAYALIFVKAHDISIEGIHIINYVKDMPNTTWAGMGLSSGGSNKVIYEPSKTPYVETKYEKPESTELEMPSEHKPIHDLASISELDIKDRKVNIIDIEELYETENMITLESDYSDENSFIFSTIQLDNDTSDQYKVFSLETEYGTMDIPRNITKLVDNFYKNGKEHDNSIQGTYGEKLNFKFTIENSFQKTYNKLLESNTIKGNLAAPIVEFTTVIQSGISMNFIYDFKDNIKKYVPLFDGIDKNTIKVYFSDESDSFKETEYKLIEKNNKTYVEVNNNQSGKILVMTSSFDFTDVPQDYWAYDAIKELCKKGIIKGKDNGLFEPNEKISRREFATMLVNAFNIPNAQKDTIYTDVLSNKWPLDPIVKAENVNLFSNLKTNSKEKFHPNSALNREEMASILYYYTIYAGISTKGDYKIEMFKDYDKIDEHYRQDIIKTVNAGLMKGKSDGTFDPKTPVTRAQASTVIWALMKQK